MDKETTEKRRQYRKNDAQIHVEKTLNTELSHSERPKHPPHVFAIRDKVHRPVGSNVSTRVGIRFLSYVAETLGVKNYSRLNKRDLKKK